MNIIKETVMGNGRKRLIIEVAASDKVMVVNEDRHYRLGSPVEDVMAGHVLTEAVPVSWCSIEQRWVA